MARSSLRVLALVTDAFGGHGGIAQYNCDFLSALAACEEVREIIVLPRTTEQSPSTLPAGVRQLNPIQSRAGYSLAALRTATAHRPIDVVFCGHPYMAPLSAGIAKVLCAPLWVQVHGVDAWAELSTVYRRSLETAALITAVSRFTRQRLLSWVGIDPVRVKILPNTVNPQFRPGPKPGYLLERYGVERKKVITTVSRLASSEQYKGHDRVIRALPRVLLEHPETIYLIVGDGDDRRRLEALAADCGLAGKVYFTGRVASEELPDHFRLADILVMPSTGEGFGIVFLEAMATGIHVIGGNQDGSVDPLADGVLGRAVDPDSEEELASAICTSLRNPPTKFDHAGRFDVINFKKHLHELVRILPEMKRSARV